MSCCEGLITEQLRSERDSLRAQVDDFSEHHASMVERTLAAQAEAEQLRAERDALLAPVSSPLQREVLNRVAALARESIEAETAEAIAAWLLSNDVANAVGVDLTAPDCPIGTALTDTARMLRSGAWRTTKGDASK